MTLRPLPVDNNPLSYPRMPAAQFLLKWQQDFWTAEHSREKAAKLVETLNTTAASLQRSGYTDYAEEIRKYAQELAKKHKKKEG